MPARHSSASASTASPSLSGLDDDLPPFFNTTFSAHRVSPLHVGSAPLDPDRLLALARRLREVLVGGAVRGAELRGGADEQAFSRTGALEGVHLRWVPVQTLLGGAADEGSPSAAAEKRARAGKGLRDAKALAASAAPRRCLHISITYQEGRCSGLLLPSLSTDEEDSARRRGSKGLFTLGPQEGSNTNDTTSGPESDHFVRLPLLLLRMPQALKTVVLEFLATAFDCRVSALHLGTRSLVHAWEAWARLTGLSSQVSPARDLVLTIGFYIPPASPALTEASDGEKPSVEQQPLGLKSIDVIVPAPDLTEFLAAGRHLPAEIRSDADAPSWTYNPARRRKLAGRLYEEGWGWRARGPDGAADGPALEQPFTEALGAYFRQHLALDLFHPGVRITKIACGGFVMTDGRLKVLSPGKAALVGEEGEESARRHREAVVALLADLIDKAAYGDGAS